MSTPIRSWKSTTPSGVKRSGEPSRWLRKVDAAVVDRAQAAEAPDLEAAAVGEDRPAASR